MERTKTCKKCRETKSAEHFSKEKRSTDGLAATCKACKNLAKKSPKSVLRKHKLVKIARGVADGKTLGEAYYDLGTTKSRAVAAAGATSFINKSTEEEMEVFRAMLTPNKILTGIRDFFSDVLTREHPSTIDEYNKTLASWGKFAGTFAPEKTETTTTTMTAKSNMNTLEEVAKMLKEKENK